MPARHYIIAIILLWIGTSVWMFCRDIWPKVRPEQPMPFTIELADEARRQKSVPIHWAVFHGGEKIANCLTWVEYRPSDDTFELRSEFAVFKTEDREHPSALPVQKVHSMYRVTRDGKLLEIEADFDIKIRVSVSTLEAHANVTGQVRDGQFFGRSEFMLKEGSKNGPKLSVDLVPVRLARGGGILNPLQPVNRVSGLRKGQYWRMPVVDPLRDSVQAVFARTDPQIAFLEADVSQKRLEWKSEGVDCLVIDYRDGNGDLVARTWVREHDGLVLRQDAYSQGRELVMVRD